MGRRCRRWTEEEDAKGLKIWERTHDLGEIADLLGRTREAVKLRKRLVWGIKDRQVRTSLDHTKTWVTERMIEWVDGFLLGDGHIARASAYAVISSSNPNWTRYAMSGFETYKPSPPKMHLVATGASKEKKYEAWQSTTLSHPDLKAQRDRWYPGGRKRIPQDVRLTGTSLRLWFLGDGSLDNGYVRIAANDFTREELGPVLGRLRGMGLDFHFGVSTGIGTEVRLYLAAKGTAVFFDLIGKRCPVEGYEYKFEVDPDRWLRTIEGTARELGVSRFWIRNLIQSGRARAIKRNKLLFITPKGFERIKEIRDREYRPRGPGVTKRGHTLDEVKRTLRIHDRRLPDLLAKSGVSPRRTRGGHYRFTEEDVARMKPFVSTFFHDRKIQKTT
jgi:hypothetical protein